MLSEVQITLKYPKILWKIFNIITLVPLLPWFQMSWIASINNANLTLGCWKKIINKFPTLLGGRGGLGDRENSLLFFFYLNPSLNKIPHVFVYITSKKWKHQDNQKNPDNDVCFPFYVKNILRKTIIVHGFLYLQQHGTWFLNYTLHGFLLN